MLRLLIPALLGATALAACRPGPAQPPVTIENARITLPAVRGRPGAAYFAVAASSPIRLSGVTSPRAQKIELHESMAAGMGPLRDASIGPGKPLDFAPGGRHAMLFGIDPALKVGDSAPLTFSFEGAPAVTVQAEILGPGGARGD